MHRTASLATLVLLLGSLNPIPAGDLPTTDEVLGRFIAAVGGREALESLEQRRVRGTIVQDLSWTDPQHQETPFIALADAAGVVLYAETQDWADLPAVDDGEPRRKLRWILHPRFALVVQEFFPALEVRGRERRAGRDLLVLAPQGLPFEHYALYFDEESGLLRHVGYHNDLEDWREVEGGVLMPGRWIFGRKGGHTTYVFEEVAGRPGRGI
jgi:hypothetical protein